MSLEAFLASIDSVNDPSQKGYAGYVSWANGILFNIFLSPVTEATFGEYVKGTLYVDNILFAPMKKYEKVLKVREDPSLIITVYNESESTLYGPITNWIKENLL